jgi:hypothetical protein
MRGPGHKLNPADIVQMFMNVDRTRVEALAAVLSAYVGTNLPAAIQKREGLQHYRTNPYVLLAAAHVMDLGDPDKFADFLFNTKLYMGLETSFGKSIEAAFVSQYPLSPDTRERWADPPEKLAEARALAGLTREDRAGQRTASVWREIDKSCVVGDRRFMTSIKSGPNCINDTQVQGMTDAILRHHRVWMDATLKAYLGVTSLDIVIGLTYGTDRTTNNKENQILVKLLGHGFVEEDRHLCPGVLIDEETRTVRVYRRIGRHFWAMIGDPVRPENTRFLFLEVLLALAGALARVRTACGLEDMINSRIRALIGGLSRLMFPRNSLPEWIREDFSEKELFWFATALTAFYDEGV